MRTAEAVSPGHPDKICDQISDAILDDILSHDPEARVAIETMGGHGIITITGELTTSAYCYMDRIAKQVYRDLGYSDEIGVQVNVVSQSPDIAQGVDTGGAGDQGIMVGYACNENEAMIPQELYLARKILKSVLNAGYGPDGKSQVTLDDEGKICRIVISVQDKETDPKIDSKVMGIVVGGYKKFISDHCDWVINGTGKFVKGGFDADTGVTGRKIVNDAYGPQVPVGGGAFSGKDPSKVDRSAAYMARKIAVDYLKRYKANEVMVKIAYSIGVAEPLMATVKFKVKDALSRNEDIVLIDKYDLTPMGIIKTLNLKKPIYQQTAKWGAFGGGFKWER